MANPTVEKLKMIGLKFGDKAAVAITGALCVFFVFKALTTETIDLTPDDLTEVANRASANIRRDQPESQILQRLEQDGMVLVGFEEKVRETQNTKVESSDYSLARSFVVQEPGAGRIRDSVLDQLLAPYDLVATAGRGGTPFALKDESGKYIPYEPDEDDETGRGSMMGAMMGLEGGRGGRNNREENRIEEERRKKQERLDRQRQNLRIAGAVQMPLEEEEEDAVDLQQIDLETEVRGLRWVAVVGVLNHKQFRDRYAKTLKLPPDSPGAHPDYRGVEMERQEYQPYRNDWSDWTQVDDAELERIVEDVYETEGEEAEFTSPESRLSNLVSFLPYLSAGYWTGISHGKLIPEDRLRELLATEDEDEDNNNAGRAGYGGMGGGYDTDEDMMMGMMGGGLGMRGGGGSAAMGMDMDMGMMMGGPGLGFGGRSTDSGPEEQTDADLIMVRALDYTVEPGKTYRYRVRVRVANPNYQRQDVAPGVDTETEFLVGPWSEITEMVRVPADVSLYAMRPSTTSNAFSAEAVNFDVIAWSPETGRLAVRNFAAGPGEFVGKRSSTQVAVEGEEDPQSEVIDFNSRQLVVETSGGNHPLFDLGITGYFEVPTIAVLLRPDGALALHNQSVDVGDEQRDFMKQSYQLSISDDGDKKNRGNMMGIEDMMMGGSGYGAGMGSF